jgi:hypothetical protein
LLVISVCFPSPNGFSGGLKRFILTFLCLVFCERELGRGTRLFPIGLPSVYGKLVFAPLSHASAISASLAHPEPSFHGDAALDTIIDSNYYIAILPQSTIQAIGGHSSVGLPAEIVIDSRRVISKVKKRRPRGS